MIYAVLISASIVALVLAGAALLAKGIGPDPAGKDLE